MKRLTSKRDLENLTNKWCFYSLSNFLQLVKCEGFTNYDGYGAFVYIDTDFVLYRDTTKVIDICKQVLDDGEEIGHNPYNCVEMLQSKMSTDKYKLFGVLWYNK